MRYIYYMTTRSKIFVNNSSFPKLPQINVRLMFNVDQGSSKEHIYKECRLRGLSVTIDYVFRVCAI